MSIYYHWFHQLSFVFNCFMHGLQRVSHVSTMNCGGWSIWLLSSRISTALKCHRYALHIDSFISHFLHKSKEKNGAKDYSANILQYLVSFNANYKINESQTTNRRGQATIHNFSLTKGNYKNTQYGILSVLLWRTKIDCVAETRSASAAAPTITTTQKRRNSIRIITANNNYTNSS